MAETDNDEAFGFDEEPGLDPDDLVTLADADGVEQVYLVLAVLEHEGRTYAVLTAQLEGDEDGETSGDLMVTCYDEAQTGAARFSPLDDSDVLDALGEIVAQLVGFEADDPDVLSPVLGGPVAQA
ncbi:MAG: DUF1292 domain-containing protein [Alphaproteobacteria bacterium]|nr:DUF1292 domain-containing protein [Alphaproteobacteria bacterium]